MDEHQHENEFEHLDVPLPALQRDYDLGFKFESNTDGPPGYIGEPYLLLYVSFAATSDGQRRSGTLHYALPRKRWRQEWAATDADRDHLRELAVKRVPDDMRAIDQGRDLAWLEQEGRLYLPLSG